MLRDWRLKKTKVIPKNDIDDKKITIDVFKKELSNSDDLIVKEISLFGDKKISIVCIDGLINSLVLDQNVITPLIKLKEDSLKDKEDKSKKISTSDIFKKIEDGIVPHIEMEIESKMGKIISSVLAGSACVFISGVENKAAIFDVKGYEKRTISEPTNENIIKGSKESFNETLRDNTAILRRRMRTKDLKILEFEVGTETKTTVAVVYMEGISDKDILDKVVGRIKKIDSKSIIAPSRFEEALIGENKSIFPSTIYTERVDKFTSNLIEGSVGIIVDGLSIGYTVPAVFNMFFQVPEDYSYNYAIASVIRIIRYLAAFLTIFVPAFYVAVATFHSEMIPTELSLSIIKSKKGVPFTSIVEIMFMLIAFEMLIEAGARLPKLIGQTVSIVGAIVVGEAAVNAKFTSPAVVVVVAIAGITGFLVPNQDLANSLRILRLVLALVSGIMGLYGLTLGMIIIVYYLASKESFGMPYLVPFTSNEFRNLGRDTIVRKMMTKQE